MKLLNKMKIAKLIKRRRGENIEQSNRRFPLPKYFHSSQLSKRLRLIVRGSDNLVNQFTIIIITLSTDLGTLADVFMTGC